MALKNSVGTLYGTLPEVANAGYVAVADVRNAEVCVYWDHAGSVYRFVVEGRGIKPSTRHTSSPTLRGIYYAAARLSYPIHSGIEWMASDIRPTLAQ